MSVTSKVEPCCRRLRTSYILAYVARMFVLHAASGITTVSGGKNMTPKTKYPLCKVPTGLVDLLLWSTSCGLHRTLEADGLSTARYTQRSRYMRLAKIQLPILMPLYALRLA